MSTTVHSKDFKVVFPQAAELDIYLFGLSVMFSTAPQEPVQGHPTKVVEREMNLTTGKIQTHNPFE